MSSRRPLSLQLAPKAKNDFVHILRYTAEKWGEAQMLIYRDTLDDALQFIRKNPQLGHRRSDLPANYLAYLAGSHIIIYRVSSESIGVVRILHERMSVPKHV